MSSQIANKILFLDDNQYRHAKIDAFQPDDDIIHCYTLDDFVNALKSNDHFDLISLDYDLNDFDSKSVLCDGSPATGLDTCKILIDFKSKIPSTIIVHSSNPKGARSMINFLKLNDINVRWHMFDV